MLRSSDLVLRLHQPRVVGLDMECVEDVGGLLSVKLVKHVMRTLAKEINSDPHSYNDRHLKVSTNERVSPVDSESLKRSGEDNFGEGVVNDVEDLDDEAAACCLDKANLVTVEVDVDDEVGCEQQLHGESSNDDVDCKQPLGMKSVGKLSNEHVAETSFEGSEIITSILFDQVQSCQRRPPRRRANRKKVSSERGKLSDPKTFFQPTKDAGLPDVIIGSSPLKAPDDAEEVTKNNSGNRASNTSDVSNTETNKIASKTRVMTSRETQSSRSSVDSSPTSIISPQDLQVLIRESMTCKSEEESLSLQSSSSSSTPFVVLLRRPALTVSIGIVLSGGHDFDEKEVKVRKIIRDSVAEMDGRIKMGDHVISINGKNTHLMTHAQAVAALRSRTPEVVLVLKRPTGTTTTATSSPTTTTNRTSTTSLTAHFGPPRPLDVTVGPDGLGVHLSKDDSNGLVIIKHVFLGGALVGLVDVGDALVAVDDVDVSGYTGAEVRRLLRQRRGHERQGRRLRLLLRSRIRNSQSKV